jgi:hypothetical protein
VISSILQRIPARINHYNQVQCAHDAFTAQSRNQSILKRVDNVQFVQKNPLTQFDIDHIVHFREASASATGDNYAAQGHADRASSR